jgi:phage tail sheath protein FI
MPTTVTYPGVYIEEIPSGVRTITGVATSITAFIGSALKGPVNDATRIQTFGDFESQFGGLSNGSTMSYAVYHYFQAGGIEAIIIRITHDDAAAATASLTAGTGTLELQAANTGSWGNDLRITIDLVTADSTDTTLFNLFVKEVDEDGNTVRSETFRNVSVDPESSDYVTQVLKEESDLICVDETKTMPGVAPTAVNDSAFTGGNDGTDVQTADYTGSQTEKTGIYALEDVDLFNLLCIPPPIWDQDTDQALFGTALEYCADRRAMLIVDSPSDWNDVDDAESGLDPLTSGWSSKKNAALFFPRVRMADPLQDYRLDEFVPCGVMAGVIARTDAQRGVWKAPAGVEATLTGVTELSYKLTDGENGTLNPLGINCLRTFPIVGSVVWGARTLEGADRLASEWKYISVRRVALYIEESLYRGTQWVVFEPNDEPLWAQIRLNVGAFMHTLFRQGAFQGDTPPKAYFVKCDSETTTQTDINSGIVNILVGFAPLKPAEFVIIKIQQMAGEIET